MSPWNSNAERFAGPSCDRTSVTMLQHAPMISLHRMFRSFGTTKAVDDVSFEVERGTVCGYIGPNGAGKTTSMRILATLDVPSAGDAFVDGFSVVNDPDHVRRRLGFMPDYFGTYHNVDCREYLDFFARSYGLMGAPRLRAVRDVMGFTGLDTLATKPIAALSKGMKQRLCLGRSLIHDPSVLVLDEPAAGLDPRARIELRDMIRELAVDRDKAILISSHILTELAEICDTVAIIEHGKLLAVGSVEEIQRGLAGKRGVRVALLARAEELCQWLQQRDQVFDISAIEKNVIFHHSGDDRSEAALLREIVDAGFEVVSFGGRDESLEDVFMNVTRGRVQ
jgi:ABC-2 type transport system ATP-binding protein